jgi:hypothetical protein
MFNLDFFHYILPPFCISSRLRPIHVFSLGYISAFYPFLLILLTWFCVELHGRNFRPIVCLWRPFHGCFVRLRRGWNTKSDLIDVFASFFLLSCSKILYQIMISFDSDQWPPLGQCLACLKSAKVKFCGSFTSQNRILPQTTYGTINY